VDGKFLGFSNSGIQHMPALNKSGFRLEPVTRMQ
jgi:hypothetical protein